MTTKLLDYWNMLSRHDWTHEMSDDHSVWKRGRAAQYDIEQMVKESPEHLALYEAWRAHAWDKKPRPPKPTE